MSPTPLLSNLTFDLVHQRLGVPEPLVHLEKENNALVNIPRSPLSYTDAIRHFGEMRLNNAVDICGTKTHTAGIQHAVCAAEEQDLTCDGVHLYEVAVRPYTREASKVCRLVPRILSVVAPEVDWLVRE